MIKSNLRGTAEEQIVFHEQKIAFFKLPDVFDAERIEFHKTKIEWIKKYGWTD